MQHIQFPLCDSNLHRRKRPGFWIVSVLTHRFIIISHSAPLSGQESNR